MKKMKNKLTSGIMVFVFILFANIGNGQSMDDGKNFMYYERFNSAKVVFQKILNADPANEEAAYWLGQSYIRPDERTEKDLADARALYQSKLSTNPNSPLLIVGMGHIELIEGKKPDARSRFETAVSLSKGKSIDVLNAIGFANANPDSKNGDAAYAIDKLKEATQIKKFKDPDVWVNMGDAYRKFADGGNAIQAYNEALEIDPNYARAIYRIGRVYQTQGVGQQDLYMKYYNDAIAKDPKFAPVYNTLFSYYYESNVVKSAEYLDKYLTNSDDDPKACSYRASMKYAQGLFNDAILKADQCIVKDGENPYPKLFQLKAFAYNRLGDSALAKSNFEEYFKRQKKEKLEGGDYATYATLLLKFPGNETRVGELVEMAVQLDTLEENKVSYLKSLAKAYSAQNRSKEAAIWYGKVIDIKKNYSNVDLFNAGYNFYVSNEYDSSNKYFLKYAEKYPDDIMGFYMLGNASAIIDSTGAMGLAVPYYLKTVEIGEADPEKPNAKTRLMNAYKFFIGYYYNVRKSQDTALVYVDKGLMIDSTDSQLKTYKEFISKNNPNTPAKKEPAAKSKPSATANKN